MATIDLTPEQIARDMARRQQEDSDRAINTSLHLDADAYTDVYGSLAKRPNAPLSSVSVIANDDYTVKQFRDEERASRARKAVNGTPALQAQIARDPNLGPLALDDGEALSAAFRAALGQAAAVREFENKHGAFGAAYTRFRSGATGAEHGLWGYRIMLDYLEGAQDDGVKRKDWHLRAHQNEYRTLGSRLQPGGDLYEPQMPGGFGAGFDIVREAPRALGSSVFMAPYAYLFGSAAVAGGVGTLAAGGLAALGTSIASVPMSIGEQWNAIALDDQGRLKIKPEEVGDTAAIVAITGTAAGLMESAGFAVEFSLTRGSFGALRRSLGASGTSALAKRLGAAGAARASRLGAVASAPIAGAIGEGSTEMIQEALGVSAEVLTDMRREGVPFSVEEFAKRALTDENIDRVMYAAGAGAAGGLGLATTTMAARVYAEAKFERDAEVNRKFFANLDQAASNTKLRQKAPRTLGHILRQAVAGQPTETTYIDAQTFFDVMDNPDDPHAAAALAELVELVPGLADQIEISRLVPDAPIAIPTADVAAHLTGTPVFGPLSAGMSIDPDRPSPAALRRELESLSSAEEVQSRIAQELEAQADEILASDDHAALAAREQEGLVLTEVQAQLKGLGLPDSAAAADAQIYARALARIAVMQGKQVLDLHETYGPAFLRRELGEDEAPAGIVRQEDEEGPGAGSPNTGDPAVSESGSPEGESPASDSSSGSADLAPSTSTTDTAGSDLQAPATQDSTATPSPVSRFPISLTRSPLWRLTVASLRALSVGNLFGDVGTRDSRFGGKLIMQATTDLDALVDAHVANLPKFQAHVDAAVAAAGVRYWTIPGQPSPGVVLKVHDGRPGGIEAGKARVRAKLYTKDGTQKGSFEHVSDYTRTRIVVEDMDQLEKLVLALQTNGFAFIEFDDFLTRPRLNGHAAIHTQLLDLSTGLSAEVAISTQKIFDLAEAGHPLYEEFRGDKGPISGQRRRELWLAMNSNFRKGRATILPFLTQAPRLQPATYDDTVVGLIRGHDREHRHPVFERNTTPEPGKRSLYKGGPEWVQSPQQLAALRRWLKKLVLEGESQRAWYEHSAYTVWEAMNHDPVAAEMFTALLAIYSPQAKVFVNTQLAVKAWNLWKSGVPREQFKVSSGVKDAKAIAILYDSASWNDIAGNKIDSFHHNLMLPLIEMMDERQRSQLRMSVDELEKIVKHVTSDMWVFRAFDYNSDSASGDLGAGKYSFTENMIRSIAAEMNESLSDSDKLWRPHQVQAAIWAAILARYNEEDVIDAADAESLAAGNFIWQEEVVDGRKQKTRKFKTPKTGKYTRSQATPAHLHIWHKTARKLVDSKRAAVAAEVKGYSFRETLGRLTKAVSYEVLPSPELKSPILTKSFLHREAFTDLARMLIVDNDGNDMLAEAIGFHLNYPIALTGAYEGEFSPNVTFRTTPTKPKGDVDYNDIRAYARVLQYVYRQNANPIYRFDDRFNGQADKYVVRTPRGDSTGGVFDSVEDARSHANSVRQSKLNRLTAKVDAKLAELERARNVKKPNSARIEKLEQQLAERQAAVQQAAAEPALAVVQENVHRGGLPVTYSVVFRFPGGAPDVHVEQAFNDALVDVFGPYVGYTQGYPGEIFISNFRNGQTGLPGRSDNEFLDRVAEFYYEYGEQFGINELNELYGEIEYGIDYGKTDQYPDGRWGIDDGEAILADPSLQGRDDLKDMARRWRSEYDTLLKEWEQLDDIEQTVSPRIFKQEQVVRVDDGDAPYDVTIPDTTARMGSKANPTFGGQTQDSNSGEFSASPRFYRQEDDLGPQPNPPEVREKNLDRFVGDALYVEAVQADDYHKIRTGRPIVMAMNHGTTHSDHALAVIRMDKANRANYVGQGFYTTSSTLDAEHNYGHVQGADLAVRIDDSKSIIFDELDSMAQYGDLEEIVTYYEENRHPLQPSAEQLIDEQSEILSRDDKIHSAIEDMAERLAFRKHVGELGMQHTEDGEPVGKGVVRQVFVKANNPYVMRGGNSKLSDSLPLMEDGGIDEDGLDFPSFSDFANRLFDVMESVLERYEHHELYSGEYRNLSVTEVVDNVREQIVLHGGQATTSEIHRWFMEQINSTVDGDTGEWLGGQIFADVIQGMGYDAVIMLDAEEFFPGMNMIENTVHMTAYDPRFVKDSQRNTEFGDNTLFFRHTEEAVTVGSVTRGFYVPMTDSTRGIVALTSNANLSTVAHEMSHFLLDLLSKLASEPDASAELQQYWVAISDWLHIRPGQQGLTERQQEIFAESFELYLREGHAPTPELEGVFAKFRSWLMRIYQSLSQRARGQVNAQTKEIFDNLLAGDRRALKAIADHGAAEPVITELPAGWTKERLQQHLDRAESVREELRTKIQNAELRRLRAEQNAHVNQARTAKREQVRAEFESEAAPQVRHWLRTGEPYEGQQPVSVPHLKLDRQTAIDLVGEEHVQAMSQNIFAAADKPKLSDLSMFNLALAHGYNDVADMLLALSELGRESDAQQVNDRAEIALRRERPDLFKSDMQMEVEAADMVASSENQKRLLAAQVREMQKLAREVETEERKGELEQKRALSYFNPKLLKDQARQFVRSMPASNLTAVARKFKNTARRSSRAAVIAAASNDYVQAAIELERQLLAMEILDAVGKAQKEIDAGLRKSRTFRGQKLKRLQKDAPDLIDQILGIYERINLKTTARSLDPNQRRSLTDVINEYVESYGMIWPGPDYLETGQTRTWKTMEVRDLLDTFAAVDSLEQWAKNVHATLSEERALDRANKREALKASAKANTLQDRNPQDAQGPWGAIQTKLWSWASELRLIQFGFDRMDGQTIGPWNKFIWRPIKDAATWTHERLLDEGARLRALYDKHYTTGELARMKRAKFRVGSRTITHEQLIGLALHWGNHGGRQAIVDAYHGSMTDFEVLSAFDNHLTDKDIAFIREAYQYLDSFRPEVGALMRRFTGSTPTWVEGMPYTVRGIEIDGGYFPLQYDKDHSNPNVAQRNEQQMAQSIFPASTARTMTRQGHTRERVGSAGGAPRLDFAGVLATHVNNVVTDLGYREAIHEVSTLLFAERGDDTALDAAKANLGPKTYEVLRGWLQRQVSPPYLAQGITQVILDRMTAASSVAILGTNIVTAAVNLTGMLPAIAAGMVSPHRLALSYHKLFTGSRALGGRSAAGGWGALMRGLMDMREVSPEMRRRFSTFDATVNQVTRMAVGAGRLKRMEAMMLQASFGIYGVIDQFVAGGVWMCAYEDAIHGRKIPKRWNVEPGNHEAAVQWADKVVQETQGDGSVEAISQIQEKNNPINRLITMFITYSITQLNQNANKLHATRVNPGKHAAGYAQWLLIMLFLMPVIEGLMRAAVKSMDPGEDDDFGELFVYYALTAAGPSNPIVGGIPLVRELSNLAPLIKGERPYDFNVTAGTAAMENVGKTIYEASKGTDADPTKLATLTAEAVGPWFFVPTPGMVRFVETVTQEELK